MKLSTSEKLSYSTIRIECEYENGRIGTGTGFIFHFLENKEKNTVVPVIITNKHVIEGAKKGKLIFTTSTKEGIPLDTVHYQAEYDNFESLWTKHKDNEVDLCAFGIGTLISTTRTKGIEIAYSPILKSMLPNEETYSEITALEDVLMIGYPNGLWDEVNNKPIFRRGITASHPKFDYCGKKEIMIDAACFPGSSGSPVFIFNEGIYKPKNSESLIAGDRVILLGILYAGPQYTTEGEIKIVNVPNLQKPIPISRIPTNLGIVIKAERILELEELFK